MLLTKSLRFLVIVALAWACFAPELLAQTNLGNATWTAQGGTATNRTSAIRAGEIVNVKDFGAIGDGSHDDTNNIQNAIDWNTLTTTASATTAAGGTTITLASVSGLSSGCCTLVNVTHPSSIPEGVHFTVSGNVLTLGFAILGVGVTSGDTIKV